jgi:hypothetical protein
MFTAVAVALFAAERITGAMAAESQGATVLEGPVTFYVEDTFSNMGEQSSRHWGELVDAESAERVTFEHSPQMVRCSCRTGCRGSHAAAAPAFCRRISGPSSHAPDPVVRT